MRNYPGFSSKRVEVRTRERQKTLMRQNTSISTDLKSLKARIDELEAAEQEHERRLVAIEARLDALEALP